MQLNVVRPAFLPKFFSKKTSPAADLNSKRVATTCGPVPVRVDQVGVGGFHGGCSENLDLTEGVPAVKHAEDPQTLAARHAGRRRDRGYGNQGDSAQHRTQSDPTFHLSS